jgi:hypothetical protein
MRTKHTFRLPLDLAAKLADYAARKRVPQTLIIEAALASHLSPDGADRLEAALDEFDGDVPACLRGGGSQPWQLSRMELFCP